MRINFTASPNVIKYPSKKLDGHGSSQKSLPFDSVCFRGNPQSPSVLLADLRLNLAKEADFDSQNLLTIFEKIRSLKENDKQAFITAYCEKTGFPDQKRTSCLIDENVSQALKKAQKQTDIKVLFAGYNPTCSVGIGTALPGSDLDTLFVCIDKDGNKKVFKNALKQNVDPLLCSMMYHRTDDLPDIVSAAELKKSIELANDIFEQNGLSARSQSYSKILQKPQEDWVVAGSYNLDVNQFVPDNEKTPLLRAGLLMEIMRDGNILVNDFDNETNSYFKDSCAYKYTNMQQMGTYKQVPIKQKHHDRINNLKNFESLETDEKLELIFDIIKLSVKDLKSGISEANCWLRNASNVCGNMEDMIQPLLSSQHRHI